MALLSILRIILSSLECISNFIFIILEKNAKFVEVVFKIITFGYQSIIIFFMSIFNIFRIIVEDFMRFAIELSHLLVAIIQSIIYGINALTSFINSFWDLIFNIIITICSFVFSIIKNLLICIFIILEHLRSTVILVFSSIALFIKSLPMFLVLSCRYSALIFINAIKSFINGIFCAFDNFYSFINQILKNIMKFIQEIPLDLYLGIMILTIFCIGVKIVWKYNLIRYVVIIPNKIHTLLYISVRIFYRFIQQTFSRFNYNINVQQHYDYIPPADDQPGFSGNYMLDNQNENLNSINYFKNKLNVLKRKPLNYKKNLSNLSDNNENKKEFEITEILLAELDKERDKQLCVVCQERPRNFIILPCNHLCICEECYLHISRETKCCPLCRHKIFKSMKVYL